MYPPHIYTIDGIVIKRRNFGEGDKLLIVFSRQYGKLRIIAKGIRKVPSRRAGHVELFREVRMTIRRGSGMDYMSEVTSTGLTTLVKDDLTHLGIIFVATELIDALLPDEQEHADIYDRYRQLLDEIGKKQDMSSQVLLDNFTRDALILLGYVHPDTNNIIDVYAYVESIIERKLRSPRLLTRLGESR